MKTSHGLLILAAVFLSARPYAHADTINQLSPWKLVSSYITTLSPLYGLNVPGVASTTTGCLGISSTGWISPSGSPCAGSGLTNYDAFTHPATGVSATTTQMWLGSLISQASSTIGTLHLGTPLEIASGGTATTSFTTNRPIYYNGSYLSTAELSSSFDTVTNSAYITNHDYRTGAGNGLQFYRAGGTSSAPTAVANNESLFNLFVDGYDGSAYQHAANIVVQTDYGVASGAMPGRLMFQTSSTTAALQDRMIIDSYGRIGIGKTPTAVLDVDNLTSTTTPVAVFDTNTATQDLYITRLGNTGESLAIGVDDSNAYFISEQDENSSTNGSMVFQIDDDGTATDNFTWRLKAGGNIARIYYNGGLSLGTSFVATLPPTNGLIVSGNVGIATTSPYRTLSVSGSGVFTGGDVLASTLTATSTIGVGTTTPGSILSIGKTGWNFTDNGTTTVSGNGGINLKGGGCFAINGACISGTGGSISTPVSIANGGTATSSMVTNGVAYYNGSNLEADNTLTWTGSSGVGTLTVGNGNVAGQPVITLPSSGQPSLNFRGFSSGTASIDSSSGSLRNLNIRNSSTAGLAVRVGLTGDAQHQLSTGTTTPGGVLSIAGVAGGTTPLLLISTSTASFATSTVFQVDKNGNVGISTTTPGSIFSIQGVANFVAGAVSTIFNDLRILGNLYLPSLATPAGSFLAVDPTGRIIATTTPTGGGSTVTSSFASSSTYAIVAIPVVAGDVIDMNWEAFANSTCSAGDAITLHPAYRWSTFAATTTLPDRQEEAATGGCVAPDMDQVTATTTATLYVQATGSASISGLKVRATKIH